jgi:hypothetical protein
MSNLIKHISGITTRTLGVKQAFPLFDGEFQDTPDVLDKLPSYPDANHLATYGTPQKTKGVRNA